MENIFPFFGMQKSFEWMQVTAKVNSAQRAVSNSALGDQTSGKQTIPNFHSKLGLSKNKNF